MLSPRKTVPRYPGTCDSRSRRMDVIVTQPDVHIRNRSDFDVITSCFHGTEMFFVNKTSRCTSIAEDS